MINKVEQRLVYSAILLLSTSKKNAESLSLTYGRSGDTILRLLDTKSITVDELVQVALFFFATDYLYLILDDTLIEKMYSKYIEASSDNYNSSNGQTCRSLCSVVAMLSNGRFAIPVHHEFWISKEIAQGKYKTKIEIGQEIIEHLNKKIRINMVICDGLYASESMITWLSKNNISYEMRFHSNRLIDDGTGNTVKVREHKKLQLKKKRDTRTIKTLWHGIPIFITAVRRTSKKGYISVVYQISNAKMPARNHIRIYDYRWKIEIFFRTAKQSLGLQECQSRKLKLQYNHISNVCFAYAILQSERKRTKVKNPEAALKAIKRKSYNTFINHLIASDLISQSFGDVYA